MFGDEVVDSVRIVNHDCGRRETMVWRGTFGRDVPVWLNREWSEADVRITTGFVEPHFFAGFSGGPKLVAPGLAALDTVLVLHDAARIGDPRATWGITHGNPSTTTSARSARPPGSRSPSTWCSTPTRHRPGVRRRPARHARGGDRVRQEVAMQPVDGRSTSWSPPARAIRSTRTYTSRSRGCRRPTRSCGPAERSSARPSAATAFPTTARTARC